MSTCLGAMRPMTKLSEAGAFGAAEPICSNTFSLGCPAGAVPLVHAGADAKLYALFRSDSVVPRSGLGGTSTRRIPGVPMPGCRAL